MEGHTVIKEVLVKSLVLLLCLSLVPYFDYARLLPPEPDSVEMQCQLVDIDTAFFKVVEARVQLAHITLPGEWHDEMRLFLPSALVKRHIKCHYTSDATQEREYIYNRLYPNITGVDTGAVVMELTARYEKPFVLWNYDETQPQTFRPYDFDEHRLCGRPVDRYEDWATVYVMSKSLLWFLSVGLVTAYVLLRQTLVRRVMARHIVC